MYDIGEGYQKTLRQNVIEDGVYIHITLKDGTVITMDDSNVVRNSLKITHELCGDYRIGTFNLGVLKLSFFDDEALIHDYSGAEIKVYYGVECVDLGYREIPMGIFLADGQTVKRKRETVTLTAYDYGVLFDSTISEAVRGIEATAEGFIATACHLCGVTFMGVHKKLPNRDVLLTATSPQLQSYRDIIEWCAVLLCGYAVIDREGRLKIISARYDVEDDDASDIIVNKQLGSFERNNIYSTDTRAWISAISAYSGDKRKIYRSEITQSDEQAARAVYTLEKNPMLEKRLPEECDAANTAWLAFMDGFKQRGVTAEIYGDASLDVGDVIRCSEGDIDQRGSIVGLVTKQEWCFRNFHRLECAAAQLSDGFPEETDGEVIGDPYNIHEPLAVASQLEKKLEAAVAGSGVGIYVNDTKTAEVFNDYINCRLYFVGQHGEYSHSEGYDTHAIGVCSHTEGSETYADGKASHAEGNVAAAHGDYSHSEGFYCTAGGNGSHAEGERCLAKEEASHAEGIQCHAYGFASHAGGVNTRAIGYAQTVIGSYNKSLGDDYLFIVGCGDKDSNRSNALELDVYGNLHIKGMFKADNGIIGGGGESYTAGDGISINTSNEISAAIDYETIVLDDNNKLKAVGVTIENAVVIQEADAAYLIHDYSEVQYIAGNRIVYAGAGSQIICGGYVFIKDGTTLDRSGSAMYTEASFARGGNTAAGMIDNYHIYMTLGAVGTTATDIQYWENTSTNALRSPTTYDVSRSGINLYWTAINPPSDAHPYGYVAARIAYAIVNNTGNLLNQAYVARYFDFASEAEYNAAVGLTYEPVTLTEITETVTEA